MLKGKISKRKAMNIIKDLHKCEDLSILLFLIMTEMLLELKLSDKKSKRMGFFQLRTNDDKNKTEDAAIELKVHMPKSSLEEEGVLIKILTLYEAIRSGERTDVKAVEELLRLRSKLFVR